MALRQEVDELLEHIKNQNDIIKHNHDIFNIYEGDLLDQALAKLETQISPDAYKIAKKRIPPINILVKLVDKLSKIYQQEPTRIVSEGTDTDKELVDWYEDCMDMNAVMNGGNEFYNLFKNTLIQPYAYQGKPQLRALASDQFTVYSKSQVSPTSPTHVVTFHKIKEDGQMVNVFYAYTDQEFVVFDEKGVIRTDIMNAVGNPDGINHAEKIPFIYANKSRNLLIPKKDTDIKEMVLLLPVMLADLNFGAMMQAFSIIYGIDLDDTGIKMSPNAFWAFKSDETTDKTPQLGVLKPQIDIEPTLNLIQSQFSLWLNTRGIKPGAVGNLTESNYASGISKMIDEMDTAEERQKQVTVFKTVERQMWDLITDHMHPLWRKQNLIDQSLEFSSDVMVKTDFSTQLPLQNRGEIVKDLEMEVNAGFTSRKRAIKKLNPRMSDDEINTLIEEIDNEDKEAGKQLESET